MRQGIAIYIVTLILIPFLFSQKGQAAIITVRITSYNVCYTKLLRWTVMEN